jgi:hypothetical protein
MNDIPRIVGGVYLALTAALTDEGARLANDVLFDLSESADVRPDAISRFPRPLTL